MTDEAANDTHSSPMETQEKRDAQQSVGPSTLEELIEIFEDDREPRDEHYYSSRVSSLHQAVKRKGQNVDPRVIAEDLAWMLHAHDHQPPSSWGLFFGPFMSQQDAAGNSYDLPPLSAFTVDVLEYLRSRARSTRQPAMRARYADLLWELPKALDWAKQDAAMARVAIDSYLEAVESNRYAVAITAVGKVRRALDIAKAINDPSRIEGAKDVMIALEDRVADDDSLGLWGFSFDALVEPPPKQVQVGDAQRDKLVADLEARLARFSSGTPDEYHPTGAEMAAERLANHYRRVNKLDDARRVLRVYGDIVRRMHGHASPLVVSHSLEQLYERFRSFGMHADADALNELIRVAGEGSRGEMTTLSTTVEIPREKMEAYFQEMLAGTSAEVLRRIAVHFIPNRKELEDQLHALAKKSPISFLFSRSLKDDAGRTVAVVGPLEVDPDGQLTVHLAQNLHLSAPWLREVMSRAVTEGLVDEQVLRAFLAACPLFHEQRRPLIEAGVNAYIRGDAITAVHILLPQIEHVLRQLAVEVDAPIYQTRRGGGLHARVLDALLRDPKIQAVLGEDATTYFRILLSDPRGWNIRNDVAHGLAGPGVFCMAVADRVLHCLLVLALLRKSAETGTS